MAESVLVERDGFGSDPEEDKAREVREGAGIPIPLYTWRLAHPLLFDNHVFHFLCLRF
jgi:hypothetical protein